MIKLFSRRFTFPFTSNVCYTVLARYSKNHTQHKHCHCDLHADDSGSRAAFKSNGSVPTTARISAVPCVIALPGSLIPFFGYTSFCPLLSCQKRCFISITVSHGFITTYCRFFYYNRMKLFCKVKNIWFSSGIVRHIFTKKTDFPHPHICCVCSKSLFLILISP